MGAFAVKLDDYELCARAPATGRPAYEVLYGADGPGPHLAEKAFSEENFRVLSRTHPCIRQQGVDPIAAATVAAGAANVPHHEFGRLRENK